MKAQMKFQKIICLVALILGALAFVYAISYCSGSLSYLGILVDSKGRDMGTMELGKAIGSTLYTDIQSFNDQLLTISIILIFGALLLYITGNHKRRKYYVTNYVSTGIYGVLAIVLPIVAMVQNASWKAAFVNNVDFEVWQEFLVLYPSGFYYSESTLFFDLAYVVYPLVMIGGILVVLNLVWKLKNEKAEKTLLGDAVLMEDIAV